MDTDKFIINKRPGISKIANSFRTYTKVIKNWKIRISG